MIRFFVLALSLLQHGAILAEANIGKNAQNKTILLTAPGTLSGTKQDDSLQQKEIKRSQGRAIPYNQSPYKFVDPEYFKFPQYGQVEGFNNPWSNEAQLNRQRPPAPPPASRYSSNPWDVGGDAFSPGLGNPSPDPYSYRPPQSPSLGGYPRSPRSPYGDPIDKFNSDIPQGLFRDTNPAAIAPFMNGVMPGMGGDNFPFSPFGMF